MAKDKDEMDEETDNKKMKKELEDEEKVADPIDDEKYEAEVLEKEAINLKDLDENRQINAEISTEMKRSYIDYAMSVIVSRALPSAEDGLKPVHRRILYAMKLMGLEKGMTKKCARIVGDTMGKFHPHGDMAIYDALVRMAQDFSLRYPLIHGQGNFGSTDGDNAAASRYCITGDTLILTDKGIMPIKEISNKNEDKINLKILSYDGKVNEASKFFNSGKHKTIKISTESGYSLEGSYNHPILTWKIGSNFKPRIAWKLLENLEEGDIALINRENNLFAKHSLDLSKYYPLRGFKNDVELPLRMNNDLAFLLGALVSEGSFHNKQILFNNKDMEFYNKVKSILLSQFKGIQLYEREIRGNCRELSIYEQKIVMFLSNIGFKTAKSHEKEIPFSVLLSTKENIRNFLVALFEGDGSVSFKIDKRHSGKSIIVCYDLKSRRLIQQIKILLLNFGITSNLPLRDKRNDCFKLNVSSYINISNFYEKIGFFSNKKNEKLKEIVKINSRRLRKNDFIPFLNDYLRYKYNFSFILRNNFDRYNSLEKNYSKLIKLIDKPDKTLIDWLLKNNFYFAQIINVEKNGAEKEVFSVKVESKCHSFVANGFINHNTEAKLDKAAIELLADIDKDTVKWIPNFDNSIDEPIVLPGKVPNLLVNGSSGIAVGMTTNIPPHNMIEVCDAISSLIDKPAIGTEELMEIIKGPDFPTGGVIVAENLKALYETGRGGFVVRGRVTTEDEGGGKTSIIITEIPYQVNKSELVKSIAELIRDKKLPDVSDIRDESARGKVRVVIELKKGADAKFTINRLYKSTNLQTKFDAVLIALVNGVPQVLTLKQILQVYIDYRRKVIRSRTKFELKEAEDREHIIQGLLICLKNLDEIVAVIKKSREEVAETLMKKFELSKKQADAILEMKLRQLTALEHDKLKKEEAELKAFIKELREILGDEKLIYKLIKKDLSDLKREFGDERRSKLINKVAEFAEKDLVKKEEAIISITDKGYIKRMPFKAYREQKRGGKGVIGADLSTGDFVKQLISCSTHDYLLLFTQRGRVFWLKAYQVPETQRYGRGQAIVNMLSLKDDNVSSVIPITEFKNGFLFLATKLGIVKKMKLEMFANPRNTGVRAINLPLDNTDNLIDVSVISASQEVMMTTAEGQAIKFNSDEIRDMGRASYGVTGIKLEKGDEVVSLVVVDKSVKDESVLTITKDGYGKRSLIEDYRLTGRACKGVINLKITGKNGKVIRTINVTNKDYIIVTTEKGIMIKTPVKDIRVMGRATQGVRVIRLGDGDKVSDVARLTKEEEVEEESAEEKK